MSAYKIPEPVAGRMLIVDDDAINRAILENIFARFYGIEEAENGRVGLDKLLQNPDEYCAVLLDVVMPVMDGMEVLESLQALSLPERIPVFLITAEANDDTMRAAYRMGVMDVISKPVVPYVVERRVNSVVELFRARRRLGNVVLRQQSELLQQAQTIINLNYGMIEALSTAIEFRSEESGDHVRRIHDITKHLLAYTSMGEGMDAQTIEHIALASIMHDVGKIAIPDSILNKPGKLTPEEFEIMKSHTLQGAMLLEKIPQLRKNEAYAYAYDIARHHHERWDGRGYPDGLRGEEISVWARVVSLADVYDALISKRVYKNALPRVEALAMIRRGDCGAFDPRMLECFFSVEKELYALYDR